ncbi:MAG: hypothetical protein EOM76_08145 [Sphingobacteriia bacterium]|jgi:glutaconyl-CoA/methylmalonyl-CoA decarboxylase subunit delta|nr:OadG family transporter subunit [Paludibacteraceae bacterium]NCA80138.1 hypothetical protein [Sphingobacteriia bacterium]
MITLAINWSNATIITFLGFGIVFVVLVLLILLLMVFGKVMTPKVRVPKAVRTPDNGKVEIKADTEFHEVYLPANASAAIAMALYLYYADVHDEEDRVLTIKKVERRYSPWSSKIYGINNLVK